MEELVKGEDDDDGSEELGGNNEGVAASRSTLIMRLTARSCTTRLGATMGKMSTSMSVQRLEARMMRVQYKESNNLADWTL